MSYGKLGLIGAMVEEIQLIHQHMIQTVTIHKAGISFTEGIFFDQPVVVCKSGVGKVNAAVCTQILIDHFGIDALLFTGVAGALDPSLNIGDLVISTECMQHDMDVTALGFAKGTIPFQATSVFIADPVLQQMAFDSGTALFPGRIKKGRILSGDQFIANRDVVAELHEQMNGTCTEMEGAAVAQVCEMNRIPFVIIRSMSDKADGSAHVNFAEFTVQASENSYQIIADIVKRLR